MEVLEMEVQRDKTSKAPNAVTKTMREIQNFDF
jgi:hypothetical protein